MVFHHADTESTVLFLVLTATLLQQYLASLSRLTTLRFPPQSVIRESLEDFMQREINLAQICCAKNARSQVLGYLYWSSGIGYGPVKVRTPAWEHT